MKAGMSAYVWWNIIRYNGPIGDGEKASQNPNENYSNKGEVTKKGYVMSQFSKFIRPSYFRVESSVYPSLVGAGVSVTAYIDPESSKKIIVVNTSSISKEHVFKLQGGTVNTAFVPYTTSEIKNYEEGNPFTAAGGNFTFTLELSSITTFVSN